MCTILQEISNLEDIKVLIKDETEKQLKLKEQTDLWTKALLLQCINPSIQQVDIIRVFKKLVNSSFFPISLCLLVCWPISEFLKVSKRLLISGQILNQFPDIFIGFVSFPFDKVLFGPFLSSFIKDDFYLVFPVEYYFDVSFLYFR